MRSAWSTRGSSRMASLGELIASSKWLEYGGFGRRTGFFYTQTWREDGICLEFVCLLAVYCLLVGLMSATAAGRHAGVQQEGPLSKGLE
jgi:hypothetical protein